MVSPTPTVDSTTLGQVVVEVAGAVKTPGIYGTNFGSRWGHVIDQAGGLVKDADLTYIQAHLNLANKPNDGEKLYLPFVGERASANSAAGELPAESASGLINLNTASASQLDSLPGIGEKTVDAIVAGRPFSKIEDLLVKKIVGEKVFADIQKLITTN